MTFVRNHLNFSQPFVQIPNEWLRDGRLSHRARGILAEIMTHSDGWEITMEHLVQNGTEGRDAVRASVRELVEHGYLRRVYDRTGDGKVAGSHYELQIPPSDGLPGGGDAQHRATDYQAVGFPGDRKSDTKNTNLKNTNLKNTNKNTKNPSSAVAKVAPNTFDEWWGLYPEKVGKASARKAYTRVSRDHDDLPDKLRAYLAYREQASAHGWIPAIPHPTTWLNQQRWEDTPTPRNDNRTIHRPINDPTQRALDIMNMGRELQANHYPQELTQ